MPKVLHSHAKRGKRTPTFISWSSMKSRIMNPRNSHYSAYGGAGIKMVSKWLLFKNFLADMGKRPFGKTLDRWPDSEGNYEPSNCRWATPKHQRKNRSKDGKFPGVGVFFNKVRKLWAATLGKGFKLGFFKTRKEALAVRKAAVQKALRKRKCAC